MYKINKDQVLYIHEKTNEARSEEAIDFINIKGYNIHCVYANDEAECIFKEAKDKFDSVEIKTSIIIFVNEKELKIEYIDGKVNYELI